MSLDDADNPFNDTLIAANRFNNSTRSSHLCPSGAFNDGSCRTVWPLWVEVCVPIICVVAYVTALVIIFFCHNTSSDHTAASDNDAEAKPFLAGNGGGAKADQLTQDRKVESTSSPNGKLKGKKKEADRKDGKDLENVKLMGDVNCAATRV